MDYRLQEGHLTLPEGFQDRTVNMFVMGANGPTPLSITISRDTTLPGEVLSTYLERQLKLIASKLRGYTVLDKQVVALSRQQPLQGVQVEASHQAEGRPMYQCQAAFIIAPGRVLVFSTSSKQDFTPQQTEQWAELLASFELAAPSSTQE
jgi:hypothetical protein